MIRFSLNGEWLLSGGEFNRVISEVPGCIHTDLLKNGLIEDPYYRDNESKYMYLGETNWQYDRDFDITKDLLEQDYLQLICHGLDTFGTVIINDREVATTDNMFRKWDFDIKEFLILGKNHIRIKLDSTYPYMEEKMEERELSITGIGDHRIIGSNYVRKNQSNYGWDWGPMCVTAGIWRDIEIISYSDTRIDHIQTKQDHEKDLVEISVVTTLTKECSENDELLIEVSFKGEEVTKLKVAATGSVLEEKVVISNPKLWWPNNLGEQNLYDIRVSLYNEDSLLDEQIERIGLRTLILDRHPDEFGESFQFVVNGIPFFAKGANWIPIDTFVTRGSDEFYKELLVEAKEANMNFVRVWGGGIYEKDNFYELCDELGLCVWQDFMFACSAYPVYDEAYMKTSKAEFRDNIIRIRNHPCLALWCGNNEIEYISGLVDDDVSKGTMSWDEYKLLFDKVIPSMVEKYDGEHSYWASSPMDSPDEVRTDGSDPTKGDAHLWNVWHGKEPFEWYRTCDHRFNSEFGFQSFPEPEVVKSYTVEEDRNIASYVMEKHQRSGIGNTTIMHYMLSWYKLPKDFDMLMWTSQILQSMAMKYAVENWRRKMPQGMGTLYWQLNDCWPVASWSSIDSLGNLKALHYAAKKFFNPVLISGIENNEDYSIELHLSNDRLEAVTGKVKWRLFNLNGELAKFGEFNAEISANTSKKLKVIKFEEVVSDAEIAKKYIVDYSYVVNGKVLSENTTYFIKPKHLYFEKPTYNMITEQVDDQTFKVSISADKPSLWVWMDLGSARAKYSDRFFDLFGDDRKEVVITTEEKMSKKEFNERLTVCSIVDTY